MLPSTSYIALVVLSLASYSIQLSPEDAKKAIEDAKASAEKRLIAVDPNTKRILVAPLKHLELIEEGGKQSIDDIAAFQGPATDKEGAINSSLGFWKARMEEVIKPFVDKTEVLKGLVVDYIHFPEIDYEKASVDFLKAEGKLNETLEEAERWFKNEWKRILDKPSASLEKVDSRNWKKTRGQNAVDEFLGRVQTDWKFARGSAERGDTEVAMEFLKNSVAKNKPLLTEKLEEIENDTSTSATNPFHF